MHSTPLFQYAGSVSAWGSYGIPTRRLAVSRRTITILAAVALIATLAYILDLSVLNGALLIAGPVAAAGSVDYREQALAKLVEARGMAEADGTIKAENLDKYNETMAAFAELDGMRKKAEQAEGNATTAEDAWQYYSGKATGEPLRFSRTQIDQTSRMTPGEQYVKSDAYKQLVASGALTSPASKFRTDPVIVGTGIPRQMLGANTDVIQTESGGPANALVVPFRLPGTIGLEQRPLTIRDLFPNENMTGGDTIEYAQQTGFDNAAAAVAQATAANNGAKPQSSIAWTEATAPARWIATWMAATRQALADETQLRSLIDNQGRLMIRLEEEDQFVNGDGDSPNISGILDQSGLQLLDLSAYNDLQNLLGIRTARRLVRTGTSRLRPTFVLVNPVDSEEYDTMRDLEGRFRAGDPFANIIGGDDSPPIWRLRRVETEALSAGTVIVGAREAATIYDRQPLTVLTADQHSDFFIRNLVVILFEERVAFPIYFPTAFVKITLDDWTAAS